MISGFFIQDFFVKSLGPAGPPYRHRLRQGRVKEAAEAGVTAGGGAGKSPTHGKWTCFLVKSEG